MKTTLPWYSSLQLLPSYIYDPCQQQCLLRSNHQQWFSSFPGSHECKEETKQQLKIVSCKLSSVIFRLNSRSSWLSSRRGIMTQVSVNETPGRCSRIIISVSALVSLHQLDINIKSLNLQKLSPSGTKLAL